MSTFSFGFGGGSSPTASSTDASAAALTTAPRRYQQDAALAATAAAVARCSEVLPAAAVDDPEQLNKLDNKTTMAVRFLGNYMMRGVNPELAENEIAVAVGETGGEAAVAAGGGGEGEGGGSSIEVGPATSGAQGTVASAVTPSLVRDSVLLASKADSDLVKGVYEGGMKVWECTHDLVNYCLAVEVEFSGLRVLELGCGAGFPGIYAWQGGGKADFQDYNVEVLEHITIPNVALNDYLAPTEEAREVAAAPNPKRRKTRTALRATRSAATAAAAAVDTPPPLAYRPRFFAGGWGELPSFLKQAKAGHEEQGRYDIILTSETIYSIDSQHDLYQALLKCTRPGGVVYVAAKTYYFGVGGGTLSFTQLVNEAGHFTIESVWRSEGGVAREILKMTLRE
jgi:predicted nicotinamide N-methyase